MSLHLAPGMVRLTVLGSGYSDIPIESGDGFTVEGELIDLIAENLDYDFGDDVDWDLIADDVPIDWSQIIYTDPDGNIYTDPDGDGIWTNPLTGVEYPGGGSVWVPESILTQVSDHLDQLATHDESLMRYSIPNDVLPSLFGGPVSTERHIVYSGADRPHSFAPATYYIQKSSDLATLFLGEPFYHTRANSALVEVYDEAITIRNGSTKTIYYSDCNTRFTTSYLRSPYSSYPIQYVCWQCIYGSFSDALIGRSSYTITTQDIENGTTGLATKSYNGKTYYCMGGGINVNMTR